VQPELFSYGIEFENKPTATAPAQTVTVMQQLDSNLDWSTFRLGSISFGDTVINVPSGQTSYSTRVDLTASEGIYVDVSASFNPMTGLATWTFTSIDPATGDVPANALAGFLPPDTNAGNGQGFVYYTIDPKVGLPTSTTIGAQASVVFDTNAPLQTASIQNTIDAGAPTSTVAVLPAFSRGSFTVSWSGQDDKGGSGIAGYSVFVSDNGGAFQPFVTNTTHTSATFTGVNGHSYSFYSVATDNVGNVQPAPTSGQATTEVDSIAPTSSVRALPAFSGGSFTVSWSGQDNAGGSGLADYSVFVSDNGGAFQPLLTNTTATATTFTGQDGHTYGFYSIATDNVGNVESAPGSAEATTRVDTTPPVSSVTALPAFRPSTFTLSWSGQDNPGGSGLASYSIYVSEDGGALTPLLTNTTATSTMFTGQDSHRYGFYSVATDNVGNVQPISGAPQATTKVDTVAPTSSVQALPANSLPSFTVSWSGQDNPGGSGLAYYDVYVSDNGGAFTRWQSHTTQTSAVFSGQIDHRYGFYSVATDNVGNVESKSAQSETETQTPVFQTPLSELENTTSPMALAISTLLGRHYGDVDANSKPGIAVTFLSGDGAWQYQSGTAWVNISAVSVSNALLLPAGDKLRFLPAPDWNGEADLLFVAWDGSQGSAGGRADTTSPGGATAFSTTSGELAVTVAFAAHAPAWTAAGITLAPVLPGAANAGETVQQGFGSVFADPNASLLAGIAVSSVTGTTSGVWQYQVVGGGSWTNFPKVSASAALLLGSQDLIRFVPTSSSFAGTVSLQVHAWDSSGGLTSGHTVNLSKSTSTGGTTPFSSAVLTAKLSFNHAPTQTQPAGGISLGNSVENTPSKAVSVASLLKNATATDADKNALGLALTGASGPGVWQYELSGGVWQNVPATLSDASVLLLPSTAMLRFDPTLDHSGIASLSWDAWDGTQGTAGQQGFALNGAGGATAFSSTSASATLTVLPSQRPPAWNSSSGATLTPVLPGTSNPSGDAVASVFGSYFESASAAVGIAVSAVSGTKNGQWQYSTDGGTTWLSLATASATQARLLAANDRIRFVPNAGFLGTVSLTAYGWDGSTGTAGGTARPKGNAFSSTPLTTTCLINTAPSLMP
jgi:hypothetical protein